MSFLNAIPARIVLTIMGFLGYLILYAMRVNLSVTIVAMVNSTESSNRSNSSLITCPELIGSKNSSVEDTTATGEFQWDSSVQGQLMGSYYYGYLITQIPAGIMADRYGAKWIFGMGIFVTALFTLLTPVAARWSPWALLAVRVGVGLATGVAFPAMSVLIGRWVPKLERSRIATCMNMGVPIGTLITNSVAGILCESSFLGGWPSVFYICGACGCAWFVLWIFIAYESPDVHPYISKEELIYIKENQDTEVSKNKTIPWKSIWTSMPVWAIVVCHFGNNWAFYTLLTMMPTYLSNILHFELQNNGIVSGVSCLSMAIFAILASIVADAVRAKGRFHITSIRKVFNSIGLFGPSACVLCIAFAGCRPQLIVALFSLLYGLNGFTYSGYTINLVDMSPQYAGTLIGISSAIATLPGFLAPVFVGIVLQNGQTVKNWSIIFIVTSAFFFLGGVFYDLFASAELQSWSKKEKKKDPNPVDKITFSSHL